MDYYEARDTSDLDVRSDLNQGEYSNGLSEIQKCFYGKTVFITGASGFLGCLILESLLRSCSGIKKIYVHLRPKKGKSVQERLEELLNIEVFDKVKKMYTDLKSVVSVLPGDIGEPMCGLSEQSINTIKEEVNFVVHAAACLRMEEPLRTAYQMNVRATVDLLDLAKQMKNLKAFVYVSTAYSHPFQPVIDEEFYSPGYDEKQIKFITENLSDESIAALTPKLVGPWRNTYALTKAISESVLQKYAKYHLPLAIARPSIVIGCAEEPLIGWINNVYGAVGVVTAASVGLMRVWYGNPDSIADIIPADKTVTAIIAALWHTDLKFQNNNNMPVTTIYNIVSSPKAPIRWGEYMDFVSKSTYQDRITSLKTIGEYYFDLQPRKWLYFIKVYILHLIPGIIMDLVFKIRGESAKLIPGYIKVHKFNMVLAFFCEREFLYQQKNVDAMWKVMSDKDRKLFNFNLSTLNWEMYLRTNIRAIILYILKETLENLDKARNRYYRMMQTRRAVTLILAIIIYYTLVRAPLMTLYRSYVSFLGSFL